MGVCAVLSPRVTSDPMAAPVLTGIVATHPMPSTEFFKLRLNLTSPSGFVHTPPCQRTPDMTQGSFHGIVLFMRNDHGCVSERVDMRVCAPSVFCREIKRGMA